MELSLIREDGAVPILIEECAYEGVRRIGETVAEDIGLVTGCRPQLITEKGLKDRVGRTAVIFCATVGKSPLLSQLAGKRESEGGPALSGTEGESVQREPEGGPVTRKRVDLSGLEGKREVYQIFLLEAPFPGVDEALVICGSDKRGTIYGMFALSEYLGVTPLVYWGDSAPGRWERPVIKEDICILSKEPSVRYRGFFINDEWPCFGTWVTEHFNGFNVKMYKHIFEFLLRMKGNYLWPAMWTASFPLDGPGGDNEELADIYGVIMGYSHHEPCLRASEEWDKVRGEDSPYGNEWNFYTNEHGLLRYWEDALKRSGGYENVITIGMRGERDSSMLGEDATVGENVALLKDIIRKQRQLIRRHVNENLAEVPQMLALYKEVEAYFYGDEKVPGLKDWEELDGVICMLCEDNFGYMRTLPTEEIRNRPGGFGMYYHLDYHGGPISYEWIDSTPLTRIWEQMCMAYEYGVRELWIVNVGDVKFHEVPLTYFMELAYDYEKWGSGNPHSAAEYAQKWAAENFRTARKELRDKIAWTFTEYIDLLSLRRPEALNAKVYHPCHYLEADRILDRVLAVEEASCEILDSLDEESRDGYYSMVHYPLLAGMNLMKLHLYAGKNHHYAGQGRAIANIYGELAEKCMVRDRRLAEGFGRFREGKWNGMQLAPHMGFAKWNEDGCRYPVICRVTPVRAPRLSVSRKDEERVCYKNYGEPEVVRIDDFMSAGCDRVLLELANDGEGTLRCSIVPDTGRLPEWLEVKVLPWSRFPGEEAAGREQEPECLCREEAAGREPEPERLCREEAAGREQEPECLCREEAAGREPEPECLCREEAAGREPEMTAVLEGGISRSLREVEIRCLRRKLPSGVSRQRLLVTDGDTTVAVEITAKEIVTKGLPPMTFLPRRGVVVMDAGHYAEKKDVEGAGFRLLEGYGKYGSAVKVFPVTASFPKEAALRPQLTYLFLLEQAGTYCVELLAAPSNSPVQGQAMRLQVSVEGAGTREAELISGDFRAGDHREARWCQGALDQVRTVSVSFEMEAGVQRLTIGAMEAGAVLERIRICPADSPYPDSYLGPEETFVRKI